MTSFPTRADFWTYGPGHSDCSIAFMGHFLTHLPHSMQRLWSTTGNPSESWEIAPTGHTLISGQTWSWGHRFLFTCIMIY